jgi:hypothetical protein
MFLKRLRAHIPTYSTPRRFASSVSYKVLLELTEDSPYKFRNYTELPVTIDKTVPSSLKEGFKYAYLAFLNAIKDK